MEGHRGALQEPVAEAPVHLGDLVMLPGSPDPTAEPFLGGARFLPFGSNALDRHEYGMESTHVIDPLKVLRGDVSGATSILSDPVNHLKFPDNTANGDILIDSCSPAFGRATPAEEIIRILYDPAHACV